MNICDSDCAGRRSFHRDLRKLRVGGIDFLTRTVTVDTQLTRGLKGQMVTGGPKWNSKRTLAVPDELIELLAAHLRRRKLTGGDSGALVFSSRDGQALHYSNWRRRVWSPACQAAGLPGFQFKMLRTANATRWLHWRLTSRLPRPELATSDPARPSTSTLSPPSGRTGRLRTRSEVTSSTMPTGPRGAPAAQQKMPSHKPHRDSRAMECLRGS